MKKIKLIVIIFLISFYTNAQEKLHKNTTVKSVFSNAEIKDLQLVMDFFKERICSTKVSNEKCEIECYEKFISRALYLANKGEAITIVPLSKQEELYKKINQATFDEIWKFGNGRKSNLKDSIKMIDFNTEGKYAKYLKNLSKDSKLIEGYNESFIGAGGISPALYAFLLDPKYYKIEDIRLRLVIAISYLTINDYTQRHEKY